MPGIVHVSQDRDGNCQKYHEKMGERPCTPRKVCQLRDEFREAQDKEASRLERIKKKNRAATNTGEQKDNDWTARCWNHESEKFEKWRNEWGFY